MENIDVTQLAIQTEAYRKCLAIVAKVNELRIHNLSRQNRLEAKLLHTALEETRVEACKTMLNMTFVDEALSRLNQLITLRNITNG